MGAAHVLPSSTAITLADAVGTALDLNGFSQEVASIHGGGNAGGNVILGAATLTVTAGDYAGAISGSGALVKRGPGTLTLRGPNAYSGSTFIEGGTLRLSAPYSLPSGTAVVLGSSPDVVLDLNGHDQLLGSIHGGGPTGGLVSLGAATLTVGSGEFSGVITGTGGLTKVGPGTLRLHGRNTYAGPTTVLEGTLTYGSDDALGDGPLIVRGVNTLVQMESFSDTVGGVVLAEGGRIEGTGTLISTSGFDLRSGTVRVNLAGPAGLVKTTMGIVSLAGSNSFTGDTRLMEGVLRIENPAALRLSTVDLKAGDKGGLEFAIPGSPEAIFGGLKGERDLSLPPQTQLSVGNNGASTEYSGRLSGNEVTLYKEGTGTWTLTGNNTVQGTTVIRSGTLQVGSGGSQGWLPTPVMVHSNATLAFHRRDDVRFEFPIAGDGGLVKRGAGVLTLAAPLNEYHGPTTVEEGTLFVEGRHAGGGTYRVGGFGLPAVLAGSGIIEATVLVEPGAALSPGLSSLATLTIQGDVELAGVLRIDLDGTGHGFADMLSVLGTLTLGPAATLEIQEWTPIDDEAYVFATYESLWGRFVDVSGLPPGYMIDYEYHGTRQIAVVVPEPGAALLTGLGLLAGAFMARTRHRHAVRRGM
jgi:autotransporter-associated beta strand protein